MNPKRRHNFGVHFWDKETGLDKPQDLSVVTIVAGITIGSIPAQSNGEIPTSNLSTQECFFFLNQTPFVTLQTREGNSIIFHLLTNLHRTSTNMERITLSEAETSGESPRFWRLLLNRSTCPVRGIRAKPSQSSIYWCAARGSRKIIILGHGDTRARSFPKTLFVGVKNNDLNNPNIHPQEDCLMH